MKKNKSGNRGLREGKNMLSSLVLYESVLLKVPQAKTLKSNMERLLSEVGSKQGPSLMRYLKGVLYAGAQKKMYDEHGQFERVERVLVKPRLGDNALLCQVKLIKRSKNDKTGN